MKIKRMIFAVVIFILLFFILVIISYKNTQKEIKQRAIHKEEIYGDIEFSGKVDSIIKIHRGGRTYGLMCLDLDYTNVDSFYRYDKYTTLKIKNNKAVLPIGFIGSYSDKNIKFLLEATYVKVNMNQNRKYVFYNRNDSLVRRWYYENNNLKEEDMSKCGF